MNQAMPNLAFNLMALTFQVRDLIAPRRNVLQKAGIQPGFHILDYGCGPGSYVAAAVDMVGPAGMVYALDIHPLAVQKVERMARERGFRNVKTILSDSQTGLAENSIDVVLLYDVFHMLPEPQTVLAELHRVLKPEGALSFMPNHMEPHEAVSRVTRGGLFRLDSKNGEILNLKPL